MYVVWYSNGPQFLLNFRGQWTLGEEVLNSVTEGFLGPVTRPNKVTALE